MTRPENVWKSMGYSMDAHPYPETYLDDVVLYKSDLFVLIQQEWPGCNTDHFIYNFMHSRTQQLIDVGHPHWATMLPAEQIYDFVARGYTPVYTRSVLNSNAAAWAGMLYAKMQWYLDVSSEELVRWAPPYIVAWWYNPWHTSTIEHLMQEFTYGKQIDLTPPEWADPTTYPSGR